MSNARSFQPALIADLVTNPLPGQVALTTLAAEVLPDGCEVFVLSNRSLYRLDKLSADSALGGAVAGMVAAAGGGNWLPVSASQASILVDNFTDLTASLDGIGNFHPLSGTFASLTGGEWSLNTSTGVVTWLGPSNQRFLMNVSASMYNTTSVRDTIISAVLNGTVPPPSSRQMRATSPVATGTGARFELSFATIVELDQSDQLQIMLAGETTNVTVTNLLYTLTPLS